MDLEQSEGRNGAVTACTYLFPVASYSLASEQQDGKTRRANAQMLFLNRSGRSYTYMQKAKQDPHTKSVVLSATTTVWYF